jgi:hypothetical protein
MGFPLVTLRLIVDLGPEGMPDRGRRPLHERLPKELWTLETPVHPGLRADACGHWRASGLFLQCGGGRIPCAWFPEGDQEAGSEDGASAGEGLEERDVGMGQQQFKLECGSARLVFGPAGSKGFAIPCQQERIAGEEDEKVILAQGGDQGTLVEFEADSNRSAVAPRAQRGAPRVNGLRRVLELQALPLGGASRLEAPIMFRISPVDPHQGRKCVV